MSSNPLMMDYGGGDLLLARPPPIAGSLHSAQACVCIVQAVGGDLKFGLAAQFQ